MESNQETNPEAPTRLECGHRVLLVPGTRVYNYYDCGFGAVTEREPHMSGGVPWFAIRSEGAEFWPAGQVSSLDASRMICVPCGERQAR